MGIVIPSDLLALGLQSDPSNHKSVFDNYDLVDSKLKKELALGRIAGPFDTRPKDLHISPLAAVPKREHGKIRLIHNLSYPYDCSVNTFIPKNACVVEYELLDKCVNIIADIGPRCLMAKADVADAYRVLRIAEYDYRFLGFMWDKKYYFDKVLPQGCSISCSEFERFSCAIHWILINKFEIKKLSHILDDWMFFGPYGSKDCPMALKSFLHFADSVGLPIKQEKTVQPSTRVELHGILVDSVAMTLSVPPDKLQKALGLIDNMYHRKSVTLVKLQSLIGLLNFFVCAIPSGRPFLRRLYDLTMGHTFPKRHIQIKSEARKDLKVWKLFLTSFNFTKIRRRIDWEQEVDWKFFSDACGLSYAAVFGHKWIQGTFPGDWMKTNIAIKELVPIYLAFRLWAPTLAHANILFRVDNEAICYVLSNHTSKEKSIMAMVRHMVLLALEHDITFSASHIPGKYNVIPDLLSRLQTKKALEIGRFLDPAPHQVPQDWLPWSNDLLSL